VQSVCCYLLRRLIGVVVVGFRCDVISCEIAHSCPWVIFVWPDTAQSISWLTRPNPLQLEKFGLNPTQPNTVNSGACSLVVTYIYTHRTYIILLVNQASTYSCSLLSLCHSKTGSSKKCLKCPQQQLSKPAGRPHHTPLSSHHYHPTVFGQHYHFITASDRFPVPRRKIKLNCLVQPNLI